MNPRPTTTRTELTGVVKRARDIMRKDPGLSGDVDRIPQLSWLLFLKAFDDHESFEEQMSDDHRPAIEEPYRWRDWAATGLKGARSGESLTGWVNGSLLPYLAGLESGDSVDDNRDVVGKIFADVRNKMLSGYLLRDLIEQIDKVNFNSSDDLHTIAHVYESMLKEMRDAAGDAGEFYTPRPVVRFMVEQVDPRLGESVMDPAVGTGGFLVQAQEHLRDQVVTTQDQHKLAGALRGFEKKPLPFLLSQMNLLLHDARAPQIFRTNALDSSLREQRDAGVDVVLTNPPFGGEEESSVAGRFPAGMQTAETSWLFMQAVMARISKSPSGRAAVVVPNGVLFSGGVGAKIKKKLLEEFDLHTVVRLPNGIFAPYTLIPTNILFFEAGRPTTDIWFYEHPLPEGRKNYTKTKPLRYEEFTDCAEWWGRHGADGRDTRVETEQAWKVPVAQVVERGYNLDLRNPRQAGLNYRPVTELVDDLVRTEEKILSALRALQSGVAEHAPQNPTRRDHETRSAL